MCERHSIWIILHVSVPTGFIFHYFPSVSFYILISFSEVARTRLREEGSKYRTFWQTLSTVFHEEGYRGLYRGLATQLVRQIPNTAIMMATYEAVVYILSSYWAENDFYETDRNYRD